MRYTLTLTDKCNKNCAFCYENAIRQNISLSESTLYKQLARIMSTDTNIPKKISFFGGEPFVELDLMKKTANVLKQYNKYNADNPITLSFITNGILLNSPDVMSFLQECKNDGFNPYIIISYDGVQNKIPNLGSNISKLVSMLGERSVRINYTMSKVNVKDIVTNYKLAESLGVKNIHYRPVHGDFVEDPSLVELYRNNMIELFEYLKTAQSMPYDIFPFIASYKLWDINKVEAYNYIYQQRANVGCNMDFSHLTYSMGDEVYYCHRLQFYQGFIKDVKEANQYMKDHNGTFSYDGCDTCPTLKQCGMCSIINEIYTGDKNIPHPTLCQFQIVVHELTELFFKMFHPTFQEGYVGP